MQIFVLLLALLSAALISALPAPSSNSDGRGATLFTLRNLQGSSVAIPANNWCTDLNNLFGDFDGKARSVVVARGNKCQFYIQYKCASTGKKLDFGRVDVALGVKVLPDLFDGKIHSVYCGKIGG